MASTLEEAFVETGGFDAEQEAMMKLMGFGSFSTTQGEEVKGNKNTGAVKVKSTRQARQYVVWSSVLSTLPLTLSSHSL